MDVGRSPIDDGLSPGESAQRTAGHPKYRPVVQRFSAEFSVERYRRLVPVEHPPLESSPSALHRQAREILDERAADAVAARRGAHEQIFQIQSRLAEKGRVIGKKDGEADR